MSYDYADTDHDAKIIAEQQSEISRLKRRVAVLETVIDEEVDTAYCRDDANIMIAQEIKDRFESRRAVALPSRDRGTQ